MNIEVFFGSCKSGLLDRVQKSIAPESIYFREWQKAIKITCKYGHVHILDYLFDQIKNVRDKNPKSYRISSYYDLVNNTFLYACKYAHTHPGILDYVLSREPSNYDEALVMAYKSCNKPLIQFLIEQGARVHDEHLKDYNVVTDSKTLKKRLKVLFYPRNYDASDASDASHALRLRIEIAKDLITKYFQLLDSIDVCKLGNLEIIKFTIEKGYMEDSEVFESCCILGHLDLIKAFHKDEYNDNKYARHTDDPNPFDAACHRNNFNVIKWLFDTQETNYEIPIEYILLYNNYLDKYKALEEALNTDIMTHMTDYL